eukprot:INCI1322.2.p1 GENE.INCI1322.2~~INCI1322.2.p1  ORF type:complete len:234 (+),score=43.51 INCI1322.2:198-899(+)
MQVLMISLLKWRSELHKVIKSNWIEGTSNGKPIYMNIHTGERQVKPPPELTNASASSGGGAAAESSWVPVSNPAVLCEASNLQNFGFFKRGGIGEFLRFTSRTLIKRALVNSREACRHEEYCCQYTLSDKGLGIVMVTSADYPQRVAFAVMLEVQRVFARACPDALWMKQTRDMSLKFQALPQILQKAQDPANFDKLARMSKKLDETKLVLHKTIQSVLLRGERLDDLMARCS